MKNTDKKHESIVKFSKESDDRNQKDAGMCLWKNYHTQCLQLPWTNLQMSGSDVTLNRPDLIYAYLMLSFLQVSALSQMNDGAACGLTRATCIFSKLILVKFLCSQAPWEEKGSLNDRCSEVVTHWGFMHATDILVSEKHHKRMLY